MSCQFGDFGKLPLSSVCVDFGPWMVQVSCGCKRQQSILSQLAPLKPQRIGCNKEWRVVSGSKQGVFFFLGGG